VGLGTPAAYALARFEFRGKTDLWFWFITNRFVSPVVLAFPVFLIARELGLRDTHLALILMYLTFTLPIVIWICTDQFRSIPYELDEAARLEGASQWRIFRSICLPLAMPGVAVSSILTFIFSWNELLFAYILAPKNAKTAPAMAITFMEGYDVPYGKIMATATLIVVPVLIFALLASKHLVRGLTMGAVK
jgi:multiple sugar transport system permease protein